MIKHIRRFMIALSFGWLLAMSAALPASGQSSGQSSGQASQDIIAKAERWFEKISTMRAEFTQVASDGSAATGTLYLRRPTQMRLQYDGDAKIALVVSGGWLHVDEGAKQSANSYPIGSTPFAPMLQEDIQLRSSQFQTTTQDKQGVVSVTLTQETGEAAGSLTLEFSTTPFALRRWIIEDAVGVTTKVTLQNPVYGEDFNNFLFTRPLYDQSQNSDN